MKIHGRWERVGPVYQREDGFRVHSLGLFRTVDGGKVAPEPSLLETCIKIQGGRRRGLLLCANRLYPIKEA